MDAFTPSPAPRSTPRAPILVASGHDALRHAVRMQLGEAGYEVVDVDVAGVASAIAYLHFAQLPHLVLLDFWLPPGTAEPLLHVTELDAALQRHRYILSLRPDRLVPTFSAEAKRLIHTQCTAILENPLDVDQLHAAIEQNSSVTAGEGVASLPRLGQQHPGALSAALAQVVRRLHLSGRG